MRRSSLAALATLTFACSPAAAAELYGGLGTTGLEIGVAQPFGNRFSARAEFNSLSASRGFAASNIDYDAKLKFSNIGLFADMFFGGSFRITGGALIGTRKIHGRARSVTNSFEIGGMTYALDPGDTLDFEAKFPNAVPYLGIGWGHHQDTPGLHVYADAGVVFGHPDVTLTPSASLAAKVDSDDLASERNSAQDKANDFRYFPVFKFGLRYSF